MKLPLIQYYSILTKCSNQQLLQSLLITCMEEQTLKTNLISLLKAKSNDSSTYRKALTIYQSILQSTRDIPNFQQNYANSDSTFALFVFGSVFNLIRKDQESIRHSTDAMLLLINQTLPSVNVGVIKNNGILKQVQNKIFTLLKDFQGDQRTPLMIRLAVSILSYTLINTDKIENDKQASQILCAMLDIAVQSHRTNILSKQASKMLAHLVKTNPSAAKILSRHANMSMLTSIQSNLYLNNIREVIAEFPLQLINDIGYRVCKYLSKIQCTNENQETYLAQTYYFLQKLSKNFSASTLEQICKQLLGNVPSSAQNESKVIFCYIQALHNVFQAFTIMNERTANKYISVIISILQQFITKGGKVEKIASGVLRSIMGTCIRKSLWVNQNNQQQLDLNIDDMQLQDKKGSNFSKVVCMLQGMLSEQYPNYKTTANIIEAFFDSLDRSALSQVVELIDKIVNFRHNFDEKSFKKIMHSIFRAVSIKNLCEIYRVGVSGNIGDEEFESTNNLWLVHCTQKYDGEEQFGTFMEYYFPLLTQLKSIILQNKNIGVIRIQAYKSLVQMIWRCFKVFCKKPEESYNYELVIQMIKAEVTEANDSTLDHIAMALQSLCNKLYLKGYECKWSGNLISLLAKNLSLQKNNSKQILLAIKYLSGIADKEYLTRVFDKNIVKLIGEKQKGALDDNQQNMNTNLKNLEILIAISKGINFYDTSVVAPYRISRQQLVVKLIGELIAQDSLFQKKAYKYIFETIGLMGEGYLNEVIDLLQANQHRILAASKHYRLAILMHLWTRLSQNEDKISESFEFMKKYLPQILMNMRQSNQRSRRQATILFTSFCNKIIQMDLMQSFIQIMCAGLAVDSYETKVSTLSGLTQIYIKKYEVPLQFSIGILEIVLMLLYEQKSEIYRAVIDFTRRFIFSLQKSKQVSHILSTVLQQLFKADLASKMENRSVLKHYLLKLTRRFGRENVQKFIPAEDRKILTNAIKIQNREKRKKKQRLAFRREEAEKLRKQKENQEDDEDDESEYSEGNMQQMDIQGGDEELKQLENTDNLLLKYDLEKENFHFQQDKLNIKNKEKKQKIVRDKQNQDITFEGGLMVVKQDGRRKRDRKLEEESEKQGENQQQRNYVNIKKRRKVNDVHEIKQSGSTFKSNRAGGDVRIKDKPQPYAFIQLNSKALNKRFKKRAEKAFDTIFQRNQGGLKGIKSRIVNKRQ